MSPGQMFRVSCTVAVMVVMASLPAQAAGADYVVLLNGKIVEGEIIEESRDEIRIRCQVSGIWTTITYNRIEYDFYERVEGDQSDLTEAEAVKQDGPAAGAPGRLALSAADPDVVVIPLHGQVGGTVRRAVTGTFDARLLQKCLEEARERGAKLVVLDIDSPGGLVAEMELICETIISWHDRLRIIAFPQDALSAAAIISLSCREVAVRPDSRIGAAVIVQQHSGGLTAVDAKMASPHHARQKQYMSASGHPYEVVQAMTIQDTVLWWSPVRGFSTNEPAVRDADDWQEVDGSTTVLTMTADDALAWGIADSMARSIPSLIEQLGLAPDTRIDVFSHEVRSYNNGLDRKLMTLQRQVENYFEALEGVVDSMNAYVAASGQGDHEAAKTHKRAIHRNRSKALNMVRQIRRSDQSTMARRVALADVLIDRFNKDSAVLGRIKRLVDGKSVDEYNEAVAQINEVLEAWRQLLR